MTCVQCSLHKSIPRIDVTAARRGDVKRATKRQYRQYMNRPAPASRPAPSGTILYYNPLDKKKVGFWPASSDPLGARTRRMYVSTYGPHVA